MEEPTKPLQIRVHLVSGQVIRFVQEDAPTARFVHSQVSPARVFAQTHLLIGDHETLTALATANILRIEFLMKECPHWPCPLEIKDIHEIPASEYRQQIGADAPGEPDPQTSGQGTLVEEDTSAFYAEVGMVAGDSFFVRIHTESITPIDQRKIVQQIFSAPCLPCKRQGGGVTLINPACITHFVMQPGPRMIPTNAWPGHLQS